MKKVLQWSHADEPNILYDLADEADAKRFFQDILTNVDPGDLIDVGVTEISDEDWNAAENAHPDA